MPWVGWEHFTEDGGIKIFEATGQKEASDRCRDQKETGFIGLTISAQREVMTGENGGNEHQLPRVFFTTLDTRCRAAETPRA